MKEFVVGLMRKYPVYFSFLVLFVILAISIDGFLSFNNIFNVFKQSSVIGIIAIGMTYVIAGGGIDLSVGAIVGLAGCLSSSMFLQDSTIPLSVVYFVGILSGIACGALSGIVISKFKLPPFIATLATMTIVRGIAFVYTDGRPIIGMKEAYRSIGRDAVFGVPIAVIIWAILITIFAIVLKYTKLGRYTLAVGGNEKSAMVSGVNTGRVKLYYYIISGGLSAVAGILLSSRISTGQALSGEGYELDAITAVVIGGGSLSGGKGSVIGCVIGILILNFLTNGLDLINVSSYYQQIIKGLIILISVLSDRKQAG